MNVTRTFIVLSTAVAALMLPYFGSVIGAVGGLTDALQSFVLPPLIFLKAEEGRLSFVQKGFYRAIFVWGLCTIIYTVINILNSFTELDER
jgi:amino acid permease